MLKLVFQQFKSPISPTLLIRTDDSNCGPTLESKNRFNGDFPSETARWPLVKAVPEWPGASRYSVPRKVFLDLLNRGVDPPPLVGC